MPVLAIETATRCVGCALWGADGPQASFMLVAGPRHAEVLMPAVDDLCRRAGVATADLEGVVVDVGPGLFTGIRVGMATAGALALACGVPSVGVTSLEALAHPLRRRPGLLAPVVDARRSEVYWALYRSDGSELVEVRPPAVSGPEELAAQLGDLGEVPLAVGDGAWRYRSVLAAGGAEISGPADLCPSPLVLAEIGARRLETGQLGRPEGAPLVPMYIRQADVRIGWEQVGGRAGPGLGAGTA